MTRKGFFNIILIIAVIVILAIGGIIYWIHNKPSPNLAASNIRVTSPSSSTTDIVQNAEGEISLSVGGQADISITDDMNRLTGFNTESNSISQGIPQSLYERNTLGSDEAVNAPAETAHDIHIHQPKDGDYRVVLYGLRQGQYNLIIRTFSRDSSSQTPIQYTGQISPGNQVVFTLKYSSMPGTTSTLLKVSQ